MVFDVILILFLSFPFFSSNKPRPLASHAPVIVPCHVSSRRDFVLRRVIEQTYISSLIHNLRISNAGNFHLFLTQYSDSQVIAGKTRFLHFFAVPVLLVSFVSSQVSQKIKFLFHVSLRFGGQNSLLR